MTPKLSGRWNKWINEDELPEGYPYHQMFPHSKLGHDGLGGVRLFPAVPIRSLATAEAKLAEQGIIWEEGIGYVFDGRG